MTSDANAYLLAAAALAAAIHLYQHSQQLTSQVSTCQGEYRGFKEGVLYGK